MAQIHPTPSGISMRELERNLPTGAPVTSGEEPLPSLAVIGPGRAGSAIAAAGQRAGVSVRVADRDTALEACRAAEIALLCVPDAAITEACATVSLAIPPLRFVGHISGATPLDALRPAQQRGALVFSLHPLQTIPDRQADLTSAPCAVSGSDEEALALATGLATRLSLRPFEVPEEARAAYHAAASIASNLLVEVEESAAGLLARVGIEDGRELLAPLVLRTAANWAESGPRALTGPIARGDAATVERHIAALRAHAPELLPLYEALAERARELAAIPSEAAG
jgi:predicted short-subunit dehydrogenase-like oxidoreductase (DUF2520 family)